jgi:hypothetical protein
MDLPKLHIQISLFTDTNFNQRPKRESGMTGEVPDGVRGYERGPNSMVASAIDERGMVVASAAGHVLVHLHKPPILHLVYAWSDAPYTGQRLEHAVVNRLITKARAEGHCGIWLCEGVRAIFQAADGPILRSLEALN